MFSPSRTLSVAVLATGLAGCGGLVDTSAIDAGREPDPASNDGYPTTTPTSGAPSTAAPPTIDDAGTSTPSGGGGVDASPPGAGNDPSALYTGAPQFLAVDATNLYWTDFSTHAVMTMDKHGGVATALAQSATPMGIAVDGAFVYWTEANSICSVPLAGGARNVLVSNQAYPTGIAVDATSLYWTNSGAGDVMKSNLDGSNAHAIATAQKSPVSIEVHGDTVIWSNSTWPDASILRAGLEGEGAQVLFAASALFGFASDGIDLFFVESEGGEGRFRSLPVVGGAAVLLSSAGSAGGSYRAPIAMDADAVWLSWFGGDGLVKYPRAGGPPVKLQPQPYGSTPGALDIVLDDAFVYWIESVSTGKYIKSAPK